MKLGLTFDEKILKNHSIESWLERIYTNGASFIELSPHPNALDLKDYYNIGHLSSTLNIDTHFHVPYFADSLNYTFDMSIVNRHSILNAYFNLLDWICEIKSNDSLSYLVIHGASYTDDKERAIDTTMKFTDSILNQIVKKNFTIKVLYETLSIDEGKAVGESWEDLYMICKEFGSENTGICWDICHDLRNNNFKINHLKSIDYDLVPYGHIHGFNQSTKVSHLDLSFNKTVFKLALEESKKLGFDGLVNLEHLIYACGDDYENNIFNDLAWIKDLKL